MIFWKKYSKISNFKINYTKFWDFLYIVINKKNLMFIPFCKFQFLILNFWFLILRFSRNFLLLFSIYGDKLGYAILQHWLKYFSAYLLRAVWTPESSLCLVSLKSSIIELFQLEPIRGAISANGVINWRLSGMGWIVWGNWQFEFGTISV